MSEAYTASAMGTRFGAAACQQDRRFRGRERQAERIAQLAWEWCERNHLEVETLCNYRLAAESGPGKARGYRNRHALTQRWCSQYVRQNYGSGLIGFIAVILLRALISYIVRQMLDWLVSEQDDAGEARKAMGAAQ